MTVTYRDNIGYVVLTNIETIQILENKVYIDGAETSETIELKQLVSIEK